MADATPVSRFESTPPISSAGHQFPWPVFRHAVWLCMCFALSHRDGEDPLTERGLDPSHERGSTVVEDCIATSGPGFRGHALQRGGNRVRDEVAPGRAATVRSWAGTASSMAGVSLAVASVCM